MSLPPFRLITTANGWRTCLSHLQAEPRVALDLEANSMYAYRERVCLIQISIPAQDYIVDPLQRFPLNGLGALLADPSVEKIFHASEYDLTLLKREYGWELNNLFDTMWAARILGYEQVGLASILSKLFQVKLNKRYQKSNWCKRPLSPAQLTYAQLDTHYLLPLRDHLAAELTQRGRTAEAEAIFEQQTQVTLSANTFDPDSFWAITGAYDLTRQQQAVLKALHIYRDQEAQRRNQPLFKVFGDKTLVELAKTAPVHLSDLRRIHGMSNGQVKRYGHTLLEIIANAQQAQPPPLPKRGKRPADNILTRYDKLHTWRKIRARNRGVESDVIVSRTALEAIATTNPRTMAELSQIEELSDWHCQTYGKEILEVLRT
jgi:ribonuclease D